LKVTEVQDDDSLVFINCQSEAFVSQLNVCQ